MHGVSSAPDRCGRRMHPCSERAHAPDSEEGLRASLARMQSVTQAIARRRWPRHSPAHALTLRVRGTGSHAHAAHPHMRRMAPIVRLAGQDEPAKVAQAVQGAIAAGRQFRSRMPRVLAPTAHPRGNARRIPRQPWRQVGDRSRISASPIHVPGLQQSSVREHLPGCEGHARHAWQQEHSRSTVLPRNLVFQTLNRGTGYRIDPGCTPMSP